MAKKYEIVSVPKNEIVVYQPNETMRLEVAIQNETVWLTQSQLCELFGRERSVTTKHINNAIAEGEISETNNGNRFCLCLAKPVAASERFEHLSL